MAESGRLEPEFVVKIKELLRTTYFTKVRYEGELWIIAYKDNPARFVGYDADFYDEANNTWDNPREYIPNSPIRKVMEEILQLLVDNADEGFEISL